MRTTRWIAPLAVVALAVAGCSTSAATPTATPTKAAPAGNSLTIAYEENCQVELIAPSGQRVLIDIADPTLLTSPAKASDILLSSHLHSDHYNAAFEQSFPGKKITDQTIEQTIDGVKIKSIAASHDSTDISATQPSNHIFVIEFNGFKIVHGGSTGQLTLAPDQMTSIGGNVDIAAMNLQNVGGSDPNSTKATDLIKQVNPKVLIPTHSTLEYSTAAGKLWTPTYSSNPTITIPHDQLPTSTTIVFMGQLATSYGSILKAPESKW